jgi:hypothetical protein
MKHPDADFVRDTSADALEVFYEIQRQRTPEQKIQDIFDLSEGLASLTEAGIRQRYPQAPEREIFLRSAATRIPRDLMIKAYGWDPAEHE